LVRAPLEIYSNRSGLQLAEKVCKDLSSIRRKDIPLRQVLVRPGIEQFACGEFKITLENSVRGKDIFLLQCPIDRSDTSRSIQDNIWETLQAIEALRACHAEYITAILPCLPYSRQDKRDGKESCTALLLAQMIATAGADYMITIDLHASQIKGFYDAVKVRPDALYATNLFLAHIRANYDRDELVIQAADEGGGKRARFYAGKIYGDEELAQIEDRISPAVKHRSTTIANKVDSIRILGNVSGKIPIVPEDVIDTASTLEALLEEAHKQGALPAVICATHPILSDPATERLDRLYAEGKLKEVLTTDTIPFPPDFGNAHPWFKQFSTSEILASMIDRINKEEQTSSLYL
jgi:ribose-phosphate pyrophosphokinase